VPPPPPKTTTAARMIMGRRTDGRTRGELITASGGDRIPMPSELDLGGCSQESGRLAAGQSRPAPSAKRISRPGRARPAAPSCESRSALSGSTPLDSPPRSASIMILVKTNPSRARRRAPFRRLRIALANNGRAGPDWARSGRAPCLRHRRRRRARLRLGRPARS
jgi:hypothetical protein